MNKLPHFNFMVVCQRILFDNGVFSLVGIVDMATVDPGRDHGLILAFGVALPNMRERFDIDFKIATPDSKQYPLGRHILGKIGNGYKSKGNFPISFAFDQEGDFIFKAFCQNELIGQCVFQAVSEGGSDVLSAEIIG